MKVKDLVKELLELDQEADIYISGVDSGGYDGCWHSQVKIHHPETVCPSLLDTDPLRNMANYVPWWREASPHGYFLDGVGKSSEWYGKEL